jgi:hypothetical protein
MRCRAPDHRVGRAQRGGLAPGPGTVHDVCLRQARPVPWSSAVRGVSAARSRRRRSSPGRPLPWRRTSSAVPEAWREPSPRARPRDRRWPPRHRQTTRSTPKRTTLPSSAVREAWPEPSPRQRWRTSRLTSCVPHAAWPGRPARVPVRRPGRPRRQRRRSHRRLRATPLIAAQGDRSPASAPPEHAATPRAPAGRHSTARSRFEQPVPERADRHPGCSCGPHAAAVPTASVRSRPDSG